MPSVIDAPPPESDIHTDRQESLPDARVLEDKTPVWFRSTPIGTLLTLLIGIAFVVLTHVRLWHTDLWDHIQYGQYILDHKSIPQTEPLLHLAQGMPMIDVPWLAQIGMTTLNNHFGPAALQFAFGLTIASCLTLIAWRTMVGSGSVLAAMLAMTIFFVLNYHQLMIIRPQLLGLLFFCGIMVRTFSAKPFSRMTWAGFPLLFVLWANCHGSFVIGLLVLALNAAGHFFDVWRCSGSLRLAVRDSRVMQTALLTQFCAVASLLNPAGLAIYPEVFHVAASPNIDSMFEWGALTLRSSQGKSFTALLLLLLVVLKLTPRRVRFIEILPLLATGLMTLWSARMINWWAPVCAIVMAIHASAILRKLRLSARTTARRPATGLWTIVSLGTCWILFGFTNFGTELVHGRTTDLRRIVSRQTPLDLVDYLNSATNLPKGIAFVPAEWAGYLMHAGPKTVSPMVNLHVHLIPEEVWNDYLRLLQVGSDWESTLERYGVNLVITDKDSQPGLTRRMTESEDWTRQYQDHQCAVFMRKAPI